MASDQSKAIAEIYAEALFDVAGQRDQRQVIAGEFGQLIELLDRCDDFALFLDSPSIARDDKTAVIAKVCKGVISELMTDFLQILGARDRLAILRQIYTKYIDIEDRSAGRVSGVLTTAIELPKDDGIRFAEQIGRALRKSVSLTTVTDDSIIGGMVLSIGDRQIDGSIRSALKKFKKQLVKQSAGRLPPAAAITE